MVFSSTIPSYISTLSLQQALELTNVYLENAYRVNDPDIALVLCHDAEVALSQAGEASRNHIAHSTDTAYQKLCQGVAAAFIDLGRFLDRRGYQEEAMVICKKAERWGGNANDPGRFAQCLQPASIVESTIDTVRPLVDQHNAGSVDTTLLRRDKQRPKVAIVPLHIFADNVRPPSIEYKLPQPDERLVNTPQLACCLGLLKASRSSDHIFDAQTQQWLQAIVKDSDEQERLHALSTDVIREFKGDELKDAKAVTEVVWLAPVLNKDTFINLLRELCSEIDNSGLLNYHHLEGIAQLIQGADT
ncbi:hypothetical protein BGX31_010530, partial [Mortierella sp. GBA43]